MLYIYAIQRTQSEVMAFDNKGRFRQELPFTSQAWNGLSRVETGRGCATK